LHIDTNGGDKKKQPLEASGCNIKGEVKQLYKGELSQRTTLNNSSMQEFSTTTISLKNWRKKSARRRSNTTPVHCPVDSAVNIN
jgi:hypothetical protein